MLKCHVIYTVRSGWGNSLLNEIYHPFGCVLYSFIRDNRVFYICITEVQESNACVWNVIIIICMLLQKRYTNPFGPLFFHCIVVYTPLLNIKHHEVHLFVMKGLGVRRWYLNTTNKCRKCQFRKWLMEEMGKRQPVLKVPRGLTIKEDMGHVNAVTNGGFRRICIEGWDLIPLLLI